MVSILNGVLKDFFVQWVQMNLYLVQMDDGEIRKDQKKFKIAKYVLEDFFVIVQVQIRSHVLQENIARKGLALAFTAQKELIQIQKKFNILKDKVKRNYFSLKTKINAYNVQLVNIVFKDKFKEIVQQDIFAYQDREQTLQTDQMG